MRPYNEVRLGISDRADVLIGTVAGSILAVLLLADVYLRVMEWLSR